MKIQKIEENNPSLQDAIDFYEGYEDITEYYIFENDFSCAFGAKLTDGTFIYVRFEDFFEPDTIEELDTLMTENV